MKIGANKSGAPVPTCMLKYNGRISVYFSKDRRKVRGSSRMRGSPDWDREDMASLTGSETSSDTSSLRSEQRIPAHSVQNIGYQLTQVRT